MGRFRYFGFIAGCWAFVGLPALCVGGMLKHPCACPHAEESDHPEDEGCGHENDCANDPCGEIVTRPDEDHALTSQLNPAETLADIAPLFFEPSCFESTIWSSPPSWLDGALIHDALATTKLLI